MIYSLDSTLGSFKRVDFKQGLNLIVVDTDPTSTAGHTRNSAGKTSIVELIHFLLGGDADTGHLVRQAAIASESFSLTLDVCGKNVTVGRSAGRKKLYVDSDAGWDGFPEQPKTERISGDGYLSNTSWKRILGQCFFGIPVDVTGTDHNRKRSPSFRSMLCYFARRHNSGGFCHPERHSEKQQRYDYQTSLSYLLGLDWRVPWEIESLRERERSLKELKKSVKQGALGDLVETVAELRPKLKTAERRVERLRLQLARFEVHESYKELAAEAAELRERLRDLATELVLAREREEHLQRAAQDEGRATGVSISDLYESVGVQLPELSLRRFAEVEEFYESVRSNRRSHLQMELDAVVTAIGEIERTIASVDARRSEILRDLAGKGALDDFLTLQKQQAAAGATLATLTERMKAAEMLEGSETELAVDRASLQRRLQRDHADRIEAMGSAIGFVSETIERLYEDRTGGFVIEATTNGPEFKISIEGDRGGGISNMEIFCMDMGLVHALGERRAGPGFLIHDSHLFDGVDSRQIARAVELGAQICERYGWQYVVLLNSDVYQALPFSKQFDADGAVLPVQLSDKSDSGGLFGLRF